MTSRQEAVSEGTPSPLWGDAALVEACLSGSEAAWTALVDKYARLILSVPLKFRFPRSDAEDIFQAVCIDLVEQLDTVRDPGAVRGWLVRVATHKCLHARRRSAREQVTDPVTLESSSTSDEPSPERLMQEVQEEQLVREAMRDLSQRCQDLLQMLFVEAQTQPYDAIAKRLGVSRGSVSFLRGRCLQRLHRAMKARGL